MPKIDPSKVPVRTGTRYPAPFAGPASGRVVRALGEAGGLTQFGVNLVELPPGTWSSQRHWHSHEDELVHVLAGSAVLITDAGEEVLRPGDTATFQAGVADGHHLVNRSAETVRLLVVGSRKDEDVASFPDVDLHAPAGRYRGGILFTHKDGTAY